MKELSPEEITKLAQVPPEDYGAPPGWWLRANQRVARKAEQEYLRQMVDKLAVLLDGSAEDIMFKLVECIAELKAQLEGVCPECKGTKTIIDRGFAKSITKIIPCPVCQDTSKAQLEVKE